MCYFSMECRRPVLSSCGYWPEVTALEIQFQVKIGNVCLLHQEPIQRNDRVECPDLNREAPIGEFYAGTYVGTHYEKPLVCGCLLVTKGKNCKLASLKKEA